MKKSLSHLLLIIFFQISACNLSPGSYPNAEKYEINAEESNLIAAIDSFRTNNPEYKLPEEVKLQEGRADEKDHWYHLYFYYPEEDQIVYAWTRPAKKGKTTFAFVGINDGIYLGKWRDINKDFGGDENDEQKKKFEERILNKIKEKFQ